MLLTPYTPDLGRTLVLCSFARTFTAFALFFTGVSLTVSGQIDFADTTNVETKQYIDLNFQGILDSLDVLEAGSLTRINRFLHEETFDKDYQRHGYEMLMLALEELSFTCGTTAVTFDDHDYTTVEIGDQCWFAENLRTTTYRDGTAIPSNLDEAEWTSTTSGASTVYGAGSSGVESGSSDETANLATYGRLYNWYAVDHVSTNPGQELCPTEWHVPSDAEWTVLTDVLGGESVAGGKMKETGTTHWNAPNTGATNTSGFLALPGGFHYDDEGLFTDQGNYAYFWSSSAFGPYAWYRELSYDSGSVVRFSDEGFVRYGFSVRCVRD